MKLGDKYSYKTAISTENCFIVCSLQNQMDGYHETSLTTKNGAHHELDNREPGAGVPGGIGVHPKDDQELFNDPSSCPRYLDC